MRLNDIGVFEFQGGEVRLDTDYQDYYDYMFDQTGTAERVHVRRKDFLSKHAQFQLLEDLIRDRNIFCGVNHSIEYIPMQVVKHGQVRHLRLTKEELRYSPNVIVYGANDGFGNVADRKMSYEEARELYPVSYCSQHIHACEGYDRAICYKHVQVGDFAMILRYQSEHDYDANINPSIQFESTANPIKTNCWSLGCYPGQVTFLNHPVVFSIDTVRGYATSISFAPTLKGTPIENILSAQEIYERIVFQYLVRMSC